MEDLHPVLLYPDGVPPAYWDLAVEAMTASRARGTRAVYASHWKNWQEWCKNTGAPELPTTPEHLAAYLSHRAQTHAMTTVRTAATAIGFHHTQSGLPNPAQHPGVVSVLAGLARQHGKPPTQMAGLTAIGLSAIAAIAYIPRKRAKGMESEAVARLRGTTDLAMIGVMRDCLLRRSEAAALTWDDLTEVTDGSGRLYIRRSKTDQEGQGFVGYVSVQTMKWVREMRSLAGDRQFIIGLSPHQICRRIASAATAAGRSGHYGGHSPRIGMTMDLAAAKVELPGLMQVGRWKSPQMPAHYIRGTAAGHNAVATWHEERNGHGGA